MSLKYVTHIDLSKNELQNAVLQPLSTAPSSPAEGQIYYNTTDKTAYIRIDGSWLDLGVQGGGSGVVQSVVAGNNIDVDETDPANPIVSVETLTLSDISDVTATAAEVNILDGVTATASEINVLDGITASTAELNYTDGVTSSIQTQINAKAPLESPALTGTPTAPTASAGDNSTKIATTAYTDNAVATAVTGLLEFKGSIDASSNPNYPSASKGDTYVISVAGKIGGASGIEVEVGDMVVAIADNAGGTQASVGSSWTLLQHNLVGALLASNNLSDVASASAAFTNIKQNATTTATGVVELATVTEAESKTDANRAVTPAGLATFTRKYTGTIGNGSSTSIAVTHGLGSQFVTAQVYEVSTNALVMCDIVQTSSTVTTFSFSQAPASNSLRVVIVG